MIRTLLRFTASLLCTVALSGAVISCSAELSYTKESETAEITVQRETKNDTKTEPETEEEVSAIPVGTKGEISLKVVSYNVNTYNESLTDYRNWHNRKDALCAYILSLNADVLCLQETPTVYRDYFAEKFSEVYGWEHFNHNMTLYRKDRFEKIDFIPRYYGTDPTKKAPAYDASMERNFTVTHLRDRESGAEFYAVATHFDAKGLKARIMAAKQLTETLSKSTVPYVVLGDFNTTEESYAYKYLTAEFLDAQKIAPTSDSGRSFNKWGLRPEVEGFAIDFCFISPVNVRVQSHAILRDHWGDHYLYSDHYPVSVELTLAY